MSAVTVKICMNRDFHTRNYNILRPHGPLSSCSLRLSPQTAMLNSHVHCAWKRKRTSTPEALIEMQAREKLSDGKGTIVLEDCNFAS